ncbi:MAG: penicillin-binding transpeptidase domain-containing protein, partial [Oscillospiraceae bacterium]
TAYYMNTMLKNVVAQGTGTGASFGGMTMGGKTGTTSSKKDRWFVGYTPYYTAAVWCGYDQQERMGNSGNPPAALWKKVMSQLHDGLENKDFPKPTDVELVTASYCLDSGMIPTDACKADPRGRIATGVFAKGDEPKQTCTAHELVAVCSQSPFKNDKGENTGAFHLATEFCPKTEVQSVGMLIVERNRLGGTYSAQDDPYFKSYLTTLGAKGLCTVHTVAQPPAEFDPEDPATWPTDDPNFDIGNPTTWPGYQPPEDPEEPEEPVISPAPEVPPGGIPVHTPPPEHTLPPAPTPVQIPNPGDPYVPAA